MQNSLRSFRPLRTGRQFLGVILLFSFIGYSVIVNRSSASSSPNETSVDSAANSLQSTRQKKPFSKEDKCPNCGGPAANQEIYVPLIDLPEGDE